jgi:hypothetical protein
MPIPEETAGRGLQAGEYREQLGRAARATFYLRVLFSTFLLIHAGFGPGLLLRFPVTSVGVTIEPLAQFYAFRPVIYALLFVALVCVLAALCRRATGLFEAEFAEDTGPADPGAEQKRYLKLLRPSPTPFVLSGNIAVDDIRSGAAGLCVLDCDSCRDSAVRHGRVPGGRNRAGLLRPVRGAHHHRPGLVKHRAPTPPARPRRQQRSGPARYLSR